MRIALKNRFFFSYLIIIINSLKYAIPRGIVQSNLILQNGKEDLKTFDMHFKDTLKKPKHTNKFNLSGKICNVESFARFKEVCQKYEAFYNKIWVKCFIKNRLYLYPTKKLCDK
jgi:hypothetical protein